MRVYYTVTEIVNWDTECEIEPEVWVASRPITYFGWARIKAAWLVLTGKCDALKWAGNQ